jgi:hypothetical protein
MKTLLLYTPAKHLPTSQANGGHWHILHATATQPLKKWTHTAFWPLTYVQCTRESEGQSIHTVLPGTRVIQSMAKADSIHALKMIVHHLVSTCWPSAVCLLRRRYTSSKAFRGAQQHNSYSRHFGNRFNSREVPDSLKLQGMQPGPSSLALAFTPQPELLHRVNGTAPQQQNYPFGAVHAHCVQRRQVMLAWPLPGSAQT